MPHKPTPKLDVWRTLSNGQRVQAGTLAQNRQGVFFQYHSDYLQNYGNLSPFKLKADNSLQTAPTTIHDGLHGVFSDSLPDGWGRLLQDRIFRQNDIAPRQVTAMDRLAFVGHCAIGALSFEPQSDIAKKTTEDVNLHTLGLHAQALFDGQTDEVLAALIAAGSSGGARPKAQLYFAANSTQPSITTQYANVQSCGTQPRDGDEAWIVKFTSSNLALGHQEGLCEAAYLSMAHTAGLTPPQWQLIAAPPQSGAEHWLAIKRFDWLKPDGPKKPGRLHMHSACGLLDADFRSPSLDYEDLIKATSMVCHSPAAGQLQFKRMIFNLLACNQDDHSKNWALLQNDKQQWQPAPFYDVTFSPHSYNEHATSFKGYGKNPPLKALQALAEAASFASWPHARQCIQQIADSLSDFENIAKSFNINKAIQKQIRTQLNETAHNNREWLK